MSWPGWTPAPPPRDASPDDVEVYQRRLSLWERRRDSWKAELGARRRLFVLTFALAFSVTLNAALLCGRLAGWP